MSFCDRFVCLRYFKLLPSSKTKFLMFTREGNTHFFLTLRTIKKNVISCDCFQVFNFIIHIVILEIYGRRAYINFVNYRFLQIIKRPFSSRIFARIIMFFKMVIDQLHAQMIRKGSRLFSNAFETRIFL